jgi:hypothetical protein
VNKVFTHMTMSLDGYVADPDDQPGELFDWYEAGEVSVASANEDVAFNVDEASAEALRGLIENMEHSSRAGGCSILLTAGTTPSRAAHRSSWFASANVIQQALDLGVVDEVCVSLVLVLFGEGVPYFSKLDRGHLLL